MSSRFVCVLSLVLAVGQAGTGRAGGASPGADGGAIEESPSRRLLDAQTLRELRRHEQFSAGWFGVETEYERASDSKKNAMVQQWMTDAISDDFERATRAIAALGNVAADQALEVLVSIGQEPKNGNRPRWMAVRALGRIGDKRAVPLLINLLDHYNSDTRLYAKVALCEITGVYFGDSRQKWTEWASSQEIEVKQMDVGPKVGDNSQTRPTPRLRLRPPESRNQTVKRNGSWPDGDCSIYGRVYRKADRNGISHGKVCLSSAEFGSWIVETEDTGHFRFDYIPAGIYTVRTLETFGYQDACYNTDNKTVEPPTFQLKEGERRTTNIEVEPLRPYHRIAGRILGEGGYTDERGRYKIEGLGEGTFIVHVDTVHKGLTRTRKTVTVKPDTQETRLDFTLRSGVTITGRFVDQNGNPRKVMGGGGSGRRARQGDSGASTSSFAYCNRYAPKYIREGNKVFYGEGEGDALSVMMVFPTESTFMLPAMAPGETVIEFYPKRQGERLLKILYQGNDISRTGLVTEPGQKIDDVTIVIGTSGGGSTQSRPEAGDRLEFVLHDAFGREVRSQDYEGVPIFLEFGACW